MHDTDPNLDPFTILFTSVGRRVELMTLFRESLMTLGLDGRLIGTDIDPLAPAFHSVDEAFLVPRVDASDFVPAIVEICEQQRVDLVLPLIDPDLPRLAACRKEIASTGAQLAAPNERGAEICGDKWRTYQFFQEHGVPTPKSWLPEELRSAPPDASQFPLFVRPRGGSAGVDAYKVNNQAELEFFCGFVHDAIIQEFVPGAEITSDIVCDMNSNVMAVVSRQRIAVRGGEAMKSVTIQDERISAYCRHVATSMNAVGPITLQCMMQGNDPKFIEINGRLGGGVPLAIAAGVDIPALLIAATIGLPIDQTLTDGYTTGLYMTRCDQSFFVTETQLDELSRDHFRS